MLYMARHNLRPSLHDACAITHELDEPLEESLTLLKADIHYFR